MLGTIVIFQTNYKFLTSWGKRPFSGRKKAVFKPATYKVAGFFIYHNHIQPNKKTVIFAQTYYLWI